MSTHLFLRVVPHVMLHGKNVFDRTASVKVQEKWAGKAECSRRGKRGKMTTLCGFDMSGNKGPKVRAAAGLWE